MTVWPIFAPLWQTLTRGRVTPTVAMPTPGYSPEPDWAGFLADAGLPPQTWHDIFASGRLEPHFHYRRFHKPKKGGGTREIAAPDPLLKRIQQAIIARYFITEVPHPAAIAFRKGLSIADHIWTHSGAEILITADIQDFFPTTREDRVEAWWRARVDPDTARILTLLTTSGGGLPQGAPTSPGLSNLVNTELDITLANRATCAGARFTRYCDDLVFSWQVGTGPPSEFERGVRTALHQVGYTLHHEKGWRYWHRGDEPELTGVILTRRGRVRLPERLRETMRQLAQSKVPHDAERLEGYRGYAAMVTRRPRRRRRGNSHQASP